MRILAGDPDSLAAMKYYRDAILQIIAIDLGPAKQILERCYSDVPRGSPRYDPIALLRLLILGAAIGVMSINKLVHVVRHTRALGVLAGFQILQDGKVRTPAVATVYDFLHRLHDGPIRGAHGLARPSLDEYQRTLTPLTPTVRHGAGAVEEEEEHPTSGEQPASGPEDQGKRKPKAKKTKASIRTSYRNRARDKGQVTEVLRKGLLEQKDNALPDDLPSRLQELLHVIAVRPSAEAGLLGDLEGLVIAGDGSPLETNADGHGTKTESCPHGRWERCDCPRTWSDPDASRGWDHYREKFYFGYNFYELTSVGGPAELPISLGLYPANTHDQCAAMSTIALLTRFYAKSEANWGIDTFIGDCGHDGEPFHRFVYQDLGIKVVVPLAGNVPAVHPLRKDLRLDKDTAVPLCPAGCPMASWGTAGAGRTSFICPIKAGKRESCPHAPPDNPDWRCKPDQKYGPTVVLNAADNPRLFPAIARNSKKFEDLYKKRTACERSNGFKKGSGHICECGHRRMSFWMIRLTTLMVLQHARTWVAKKDAELHLLRLLGLEAVLAA